MSDKATPNWRGMSDDEGHGIYDENGKWIAHLTDQKHTEKIVKAVNRDHLFDELVNRLDLIVPFIPNIDEQSRVKDLLQRAKAAK